MMYDYYTNTVEAHGPEKLELKRRFKGVYNCRAAALDDFYEPAARALMRLHALQGQRRQALDVFGRLERRLRDQRARPGKETLLLRHAIQANFSPSRLAAAPL